MDVSHTVKQAEKQGVLRCRGSLSVLIGVDIYEYDDIETQCF